MARKFLISRVALAVALASGMAAVAPTVAVAAKAPKASFSKEYAAAAAPIDKILAEKKEDPTLAAAAEQARNAKTDAERAAARAAVDAALDGITAKLDAAGALATVPLDKVKQGEMVRAVGVYMNDPAMQHKGLLQMIESGQMPPEAIGQVQYLAGVTSYQTKNYADAAHWLQIAYDGGYRDAQNMIQPLLADSYKRSGNSDAALAMVQKEIEAAKASGNRPAEVSLRSALQAAYDAKKIGPSTEYAAMLAEYYPSPDTWNIAISIVRQLASLPKAQNIDLMRLMNQTGAMRDKRDYLEYVEDVDPRAYPGEAVKIMNAGLAKGLVSSAELPDKANAEARVSADKASLPAQERDANKPGATVATLTASGDVFLSYDQPEKAETFYAKALGMPGVDANKVALRLGMAQAQQGKYAEAKANLAKVNGTLAPVAKLWAAYAGSKSAS